MKDLHWYLFIGFAAILSTLQPFQICICNRKYSKWTFSNGPHMMRKRCMANLHASLDSTWKSRFSQNSTRTEGVYSTTFGTKLSYEAKKFIQFWGGIFNNLVILQSVMHLKNFQTVRTCFTAKGAKMHKYRTVPTCFTAKKHTKLLPKSIAVHTHQSWKQEWDVTIVIPTMHCNVTPDVTFGGYIPQLLILNSQMKQKNFPILQGGIFHNFSSWTQKWKIYIDIFYRVCCNIKHITAISNLYLQ